jgi:uncharacterized OB-fold protein
MPEKLYKVWCGDCGHICWIAYVPEWCCACGASTVTIVDEVDLEGEPDGTVQVQQVR